MGKIHSIETMGLVDGPGVRFVVFFQGCPNRCIFCHNPDTWELNGGFDISAQELIRKILKYKNYYGNQGGVTFSGGEPMIQKDFLIELLKLCKTCNLHTCLDTSGVGVGDYEEILKYTDLVLLDIKALEEESYLAIVKNKKKEFDKFLDVCQKMKKKLWIRQVILPGINDNEEYLLKLKEFIQTLSYVEKVELLPYHSMAKKKYQELGIAYSLDSMPDMDQERLEELKKIIEEK